MDLVIFHISFFQKSVLKMNKLKRYVGPCVND